jgi:hypothetical protein
MAEPSVVARLMTVRIRPLPPGVRAWPVAMARLFQLAVIIWLLWKGLHT